MTRKNFFGSRRRSETLFVVLYIVLVSLALAHSIYTSYQNYFAELHSGSNGESASMRYLLHSTIALSADHPLFAGKGHAPNQYRIGILYPAKVLSELLHIRKYYIAVTAFDFGFCALSCVGLYALLLGSTLFAGWTESMQRLAVVLLMACLAFPLEWVVPWERPETLPSALYLTGMLLLVQRISTSEKISLAGLAAIVCSTLWQGLIRADVAIIFGVAMVLFSLATQRSSAIRSWRTGVLYGLTILSVATGVQLYLQWILYPHATYPPDTAVVQLLLNLNARRIAPFTIAILPYAILLTIAARTQILGRLDPVDLLAGLAAILYLPLWIAVGSVGEVRVFVPFLLTLTPAAAKLLALLDGTEADGDIVALTGPGHAT